MKSTPFNHETDLAPIPFEAALCRKAMELKKAGLHWNPHVGCWVCDADNRIPVPSPFPEHIYFILNMNHFLRIFGTAEDMQRDLVWLPTWHQCLQISTRLEAEMRGRGTRAPIEKPQDLYTFYAMILVKLQKGTNQG